LKSKLKKIWKEEEAEDVGKRFEERRNQVDIVMLLKNRKAKKRRKNRRGRGGRGGEEFSFRVQSVERKEWVWERDAKELRGRFSLPFVFLFFFGVVVRGRFFFFCLFANRVQFFFFFFYRG